MASSAPRNVDSKVKVQTFGRKVCRSATYTLCPIAFAEAKPMLFLFRKLPSLLLYALLVRVWLK